ncbi:peptide-methionine (S)-S-oxide reductase MsrA [Thalassobaculum sp.]|jgi:peptide-methionine (S)-S-oxide reductase|uniref:peptide-methionine (S)-S-oxide reductase MsrA n=1 Tax=Thalassobaculum sp. TaxID=2022740 RepID=UPI0032EBDBF0
MAKAMFAAGCFWSLEETFRNVTGVSDVAVGYSGGVVADPTYEQVCSGTTGHAEVVLIEFDQRKVDYDELLEVFWDAHDPTQVNRQGADIGSQYRSAIFTFDSDQEAVARESKHGHDASGRFARPIATEITPAGPFWRAEERHQRYLAKRSGALAEKVAH